MTGRTLGGVLLAVGAALTVIGAVGTVGTVGRGAPDDPRGSPAATIAGATSSPTTASATPRVEVTSPPTTPTSSPTPSPTPTATPSVETVDEFVAVFIEAFRTGDERFLQARLHPEVIELYGQDQCLARVTAFEDATFDIGVESVTGPAEWTWEVDEVATPIPDTYTITGTITREGEATPTEIHYSLVDGTLHWFTDCGDPAV